MELFFKALKQNLKVKTFVGNTENALYIHIWTALIAILRIKYLKFKSKFGWSLSNLVAFIRWNLFTYRDLWEWIDSPFDVLPLQPGPVQYPLPLPGLGQQWFIIYFEEKDLMKKYGNEYREYMKKVPYRIIPKVF